MKQYVLKFHEVNEKFDKSTAVRPPDGSEIRYIIRRMLQAANDTTVTDDQLADLIINGLGDPFNQPWFGQFAKKHQRTYSELVRSILSRKGMKAAVGKIRGTSNQVKADLPADTEVEAQ